MKKMKNMKNMKKMKKTKHVGTSKNKRAMSGGSKGRQGKVSKYTQKFKSCYISFIKVAESDADDVENDNTKIRKMEEWGRLRGIYTYLKSKKLNESGDKTFLEQMLDNTKDSKYIQDYKNVIDCFEQNNNILLQEGCVPEKEYVNSKGGSSEAPADAKVEGQSDTKNVYNAENVKAPVDDVTQQSTSDSLASIETGSTIGYEDYVKESHRGGRSKRSSRSSRRRRRRSGKSMKSKKGRKTHRR